MVTDSPRSQQIYLTELDDDVTPVTRKTSRIELRTMCDAYRLKPIDTTIPPADTGSTSDESQTNLRRMAAYCTAESYNLKKLYKLLENTYGVDQVQIFFGECLYASYKPNNGYSCSMYFMNYGVTIFWGLDESEEEDILKRISSAQENPYDIKEIERENFMYGISKHSQIWNDKIYITEDKLLPKMAVSVAVAQSVKLDYFEELVDSTIETVKDLPDEIEKAGKLGRRRQDIFRVMGRLYKLSFNLYLISNILGEPEFIWEYPGLSPLYETCVRYMDTKTRADSLNKRIEIIHGILEILSGNITTHNSEKLERTMMYLIGISAVFGLLQCSILVLMILMYKFKWF